jgi:genome maintenance exonuclease 1
MDTRLLKIREMKRFCKWVDTRNVAQLSQYSTMAEFDRADTASKKNEFFFKRSNGNYKWPSGRNSRTCISILDIYSFGYKMKDYINKRQERKRTKGNKKKEIKMKKEVVRSKDKKRTVGMYPESLRETTFIHNNKYKEKYIWPNNSHLLLSPSRILDGTKDKTGLDAWRKRVGEEEANRIIEESQKIGKSLHTYIENSVWKFCNVRYQNHPPLINPIYHPHADLVSKMGNIVLEKGLKNSLEEVYGLESYIYYSIYFRGIIDLVGKYEGEDTIVDFKTKTKMPKEEWMEDWFMQVAAYGMAHNFRCGTNIKKGVVLLITRELEFKKIIIQGNDWNKYYRMFCEKLKDFVSIDRDNKEEEFKYAQERYKELEKTIQEIK